MVSSKIRQINFLTHQFLKVAGVIKVPDSVLRPATDFIRSAYAKFLLLDIEDGSFAHTPELRSLRIFLQRDAKNYVEHEGDYIGTTIDVPLSKLPYQKSLPGNLGKLRFGCHLVDKSVQDLDAHGTWTEANLLRNRGFIGIVRIQADFQKDLEKLKKHSWSPKIYGEILRELMMTTRHECQHLVQAFLDYTVTPGYRGDIRGGMPPKITDPHYFSSGEHRDGKQPRQEYAQHPIEFQTLLTDSVERFHERVRSIPLALREAFSRYWSDSISEENFINLSRPIIKSQPLNQSQADGFMTAVDAVQGDAHVFRIWHQSDPARWRLAVRELMRTV